MIKFYDCKKIVVINICGHYQENICNFLSILTQFVQFIFPKMFVSFMDDRTFIIAKKHKEKIFLRKLVKYIITYLNENKINFDFYKIKKYYLKMNGNSLIFEVL